MIKSMTAYSTAEYATDQVTVSTEIRSYNSRYLDLVLRIPSGYQSLEEKIKFATNISHCTGTITMVSRVAVQRPVTKVIAIEPQTIEYSGIPSAMGKSPSAVVAVVIKQGLIRINQFG